MSPHELGRDVLLNTRLYIGDKVVGFDLRISDQTAEAMRPLPRDRELPFMVTSRRDAELRKEERRHIVRILAQDLAEHLMKAIESTDPVHGCEPEPQPMPVEQFRYQPRPTCLACGQPTS